MKILLPETGPGPAPAEAPPREAELLQALGRFIENQRAPRTRTEYGKALDDALSTLGIHSLQDLVAVTPEDIVAYRNELQARGLSPSTINGRISALRGLFGRLLLERRIAGNPADPQLVKGLQVSDVSRTEHLTVEEVSAVLSTCDGTLRGLRDRALLLTLYFQGLRRSEAARLRYRDVTTKRGLLEVRQAKNNPYALVRLHSEVREAIDAFLEVLHRDLRQRETRADEPIFTSLSKRSFGRALCPDAINEIVKERARQAGIERRITAHSWRHTCATEALAAGTPLQQVQRHLRHKDVRTTTRYDHDRDPRRNPTLDRLPSP